jgi:hypothetical protein
MQDISNSAHHELSAAQPEKHGLPHSIDTHIVIVSCRGVMKVSTALAIRSKGGEHDKLRHP